MYILNEKTEMETMVSCMEMLNQLGFTSQFKASSGGLMSLTSKQTYAPEEVIIANFYRFEGESDPQDNSILYAIETMSGELGTLTDAYGMYCDGSVCEFINKVEKIQKKSLGILYTNEMW